MIAQLKKVPLLRIILPFAVGIALEAEFMWEIEKGFLFFLLSLFLVWLVGKKVKVLKKIKHRYWVGLVMITCSFSLGVLYTSFRFENKKQSYFDTTESISDFFLIEIRSAIQEKTKTNKTFGEVISVQNEGEWKGSSGRVLLYFKKDSLSDLLEIGDQILINLKPGVLQEPKNPHEFNYKKYLNNHQVHSQVFLKNKDWKLIENTPSFSLLKFASKARQELLSKLTEYGIVGNEYAVISALVFGNKDALDKDLFQSYSSAGAMHVLAVSGLHVGLVYLIFNSLLFFLNKSKKSKIWKAIILIILLWSYAVLTGMSASVFRAVTMFSFIIWGKIIFRNSSIYNTIAASAGVLLIVNPFIISEVGFQLSYLAVIGIIYLQPKIYNLFFFNSILLDKIWGLTAVSLAAQIATFPLGLLYFHQFPTYFLVSNLFVIPLATLILYVTFLFMVFSWFEPVAYLLGNLVSLITKLLNFTVDKMQLLPYNQIQGVVISVPQVYLIYGFLLFFSWWVLKRNQFAMWGTGFAVLSLIGLFISESQSHMEQEEILFYSVSGESAISITQGDTCHFISSKPLFENKDRMTFHVSNHMNNLGSPIVIFHDIDSLENFNGSFLVIQDQFVQAFDKRIYIQKGTVEGKGEKRIEVDYIVLRENNTRNLKNLFGCIKANDLVIDGTNYQNYSGNKMVLDFFSEKKIHRLNQKSLLLNLDSSNY